MLFTWNQSTIRWYTDAGDYTGFFKNLAGAITPMLEGHETFCDMGCGLGLIDVELSGSIGSITSVDISAEALKALETRRDSRGITNIQTVLSDCADVAGFWDIIYLCFFSSRNLDLFLPKCKKLIVVVGGENNADLFPPEYRRKKKNTISQEQEYLSEIGLDYKLTKASFDFGQPLRTYEDACEYVRTYAHGIPQAELDSFLESRLVEAESGFKYYLPRSKSVGIFEIDASGAGYCGPRVKPAL